MPHLQGVIAAPALLGRAPCCRAPAPHKLNCGHGRGAGLAPPVPRCFCHLARAARSRDGLCGSAAAPIGWVIHARGAERRPTFRSRGSRRQRRGCGVRRRHLCAVAVLLQLRRGRQRAGEAAPGKAPARLRNARVCAPAQPCSHLCAAGPLPAWRPPAVLAYVAPCGVARPPCPAPPTPLPPPIHLTLPLPHR